MKLSILAIAWLSAAPPIFAATVLEDTIAKTLPLDPHATVRIQNENGAIWIYGANVAEARIQAIKRAYSKERLDLIHVEVIATDKNLTIETKYPPGPHWSLRDRSGTVDYVVVVPWTCTIERAELGNGEILIDGMHGSAMRATLKNGRMFVHNCFGSMQAEVGNGALDVAYEWWENVQFSLEAKIDNGNVHALFPRDAMMHLLASSVNGHVTSDFVGEPDREGGGTPKIDIVTSGDVRAEIKLQATNGGVQIAQTNY